MPSPLVSHYRSAAKHSEDRSPPCIGSRKWRISSLARALVRARFREDSRFSAVLKVAVNTGFDDLQSRFALIQGVTRDRSQRRPVARHTRLISFTSRRMRSGRGTVVLSAVSLSTVFTANLCTVRYTHTDHLPKSAPGHQTHASSLHSVNRNL